MLSRPGWPRISLSGLMGIEMEFLFVFLWNPHTMSRQSTESVGFVSLGFEVSDALSNRMVNDEES
ncbi:MAG: hypothetical protein ACKPEY_12550 [Planctomycetota bacterium]